MRVCDRLGEVPRIMLMMPRTRTTATAPIATKVRLCRILSIAPAGFLSPGRGFAAQRLLASFSGERFLDLGLQHLYKPVRIDGSDILVADDAVRADHESFGDAIDAPIDAGAAAGVDADRGIGVA